jgi:pimeloyl-ACP methyl ester carboxylesterase
MSVLSADGIVLKGILEYPETSPGTGFPLAVLAHQYPATADSFGPLVEDLLDLGIACLAFDERGHGASIMGSAGPVVIDTPFGFTAQDFGQAFVSSVSKVGFHRIDDDIIRVASWGAAQNFIGRRLLLVGCSVAHCLRPAGSRDRPWNGDLLRCARRGVGLCEVDGVTRLKGLQCG